MKRLFKILVCLVFALTVSLAVLAKVKYPIKYKTTVEKYSARFNVNAELIFSVIKCESSFDKNALSKAGAVGLMQILPSTAQFIAKSLAENSFDLFLPDTNVRYGTWYLKYLLNKFKSERLALYAYNAGEGVVSKWIESGEKRFVYSQTKIYADRVLKAKKIYRFIYYRG